MHASVEGASAPPAASGDDAHEPVIEETTGYLDCFSWPVQHAATVGQKRDGGKYPKTWDSNYGSYPGRIYSQYQNTTLHTPLKHACLFTLASMARLGCTSASRSTVFYSIDDILHTSHNFCIFLNSIGALKDRNTILIGFIFRELHNRYAINSSNYITVLPLSMLHINVLLPPHCSMKPA